MVCPGECQLFDIAVALITEVNGNYAVCVACNFILKLIFCTDFAFVKLCYTNISLPLTAIADFEKLGATNPMFAELAKIVAKTKGLWNAEAEKYLLANAKSI